MNAVTPFPLYDPGGDRLPVPPTGRELTIYNPYLQAQLAEDEIDLRKLWRTISKYRWIIVAVFLVSVLTTLIANLLTQPVYRASALIEVQPSQRAVKFDNLQQANTWDPELLMTQTSILLSESVAAAVVDEMNLGDDPEFNGEFQQRGLAAGLSVVSGGIKSALAALTDALAPAEPTDAGDMYTIPPEVLLRRYIVGVYQSKLSVDQVTNSDLLTVSFDSFSPRKAAAIANAHTKAYLRLGEQRRFDSTAGAKNFLEQQIEEAQAGLETSEKALTDFARQRNIVDVEDRNNVMATRLQELNQALTRTRQDRIVAEVAYRQAKLGEIESLPAVLAGTLIKELREDYAAMEAEYQEKSRIFKKSYPKMQQIAAKKEDLKATLNRESQRLVTGLRNNYEQLLAQERQVARQVSMQQQEMLDLKDRAIQYNILKRGWEANKQLYAGLLDKQKDVRVAAGMEVNNISVIDDAEIPVAKNSPRIKLNVTVAGVFGLMAGLGIAFLLAFMDNSFRSGEDLENVLGIPFLGLVPHIAAGKSPLPVPLHLLSDQDRLSAMAEAVRSIRTSILFSRPDNVPKRILVTSSTSGEGKTTIVSNLALVLAQNGSRVLILEADLRKPNIAKWLDVDQRPGLTEYLGGDRSSIVKATAIENIYCVPAGGHHANPAELIGSAAMEEYLNTLSKYFDFIIIDGPPVLGLADSLVLSSKVDGVVMMVKGGDTEREAVRESVKRLRTVNAPLVGTILNDIDLSQREYSYYQNNYYGYADPKRKRVTDESCQYA